MKSSRLPDLDQLSERRSGVLTNHADVLWYFGQERTIAEAAEQAALSRSTIRRYVMDLVEAGYLTTGQRGGAKTYRRVD